MKNMHFIVHALLVGLLLASFVVSSRKTARLRLENQQLHLRLLWIEDANKRLARGEGRLSLYSMEDGDQLLECFSGRKDVEQVSLEQAGVGPVGLRAIAGMPNVNSISLSGELGVNDITLLNLAECRNLQSLELTCTGVTRAGVSAFQMQMPKCKIRRFPAELEADQ